MSALIDTHILLFKHIERANRVWLDSVTIARAAEFELGKQLLQCANPADAAGICRRWTTAQVQRFVETNRRLTQLWLDFPAGPPSAPRNLGP
jgi:hypothetical protein